MASSPAVSTAVTTLTHKAFAQEWVVLQQLASMDHAFSLWDSALHYIRFLEANLKEVAKLRGKRVLEVGAGTGLVGMVLADVAGCTVTSTDLSHVMPNLRACFRANGFVGDDCGVFRRATSAGSVVPVVYGWGDDLRTLLASHGPWDVIIGTDVVYSEYLVPALLRSVATAALASEGRLGELAPQWDTPPARPCIAYFANEVRSTLTHEIFCETSARYFRVKQLRKSRYHADSKDTSLHIFELRARTDGILRPAAATAGTAAESARSTPELVFDDGVAFHVCLAVPEPSDAIATALVLPPAHCAADCDAAHETALPPAPTAALPNREPAARAAQAQSRNPLHLRASGLDRTLLPEETLQR